MEPDDKPTPCQVQGEFCHGTARRYCTDCHRAICYHCSVVVTRYRYDYRICDECESKQPEPPNK